MQQTRRATALPPEERRAAIVDATRPLLLEHGETVTTRQIAEAAGIAEGTIFRVFEDKDKLLSATLDAALDLAPFERAIDAIDQTLTFDEQLEEATRIIQDRFVDVWRLVSNLGPALQQQAARRRNESGALVALFERGRDELRLEPRDASRMLRALTMSLTHPMLAGEPKTEREIVSLLLHGISRPR